MREDAISFENADLEHKMQNNVQNNYINDTKCTSFHKGMGVVTASEKERQWK